jgi:hypothetical protein
MEKSLGNHFVISSSISWYRTKAFDTIVAVEVLFQMKKTSNSLIIYGPDCLKKLTTADYYLNSGLSNNGYGAAP